MTTAAWRQKQHGAWPQLSRRLTRFGAACTGRTPTHVTIEPALGGPPGVYNHRTKKIALDATQLLPGQPDPKYIDLHDIRDQAQHPELTGALAHELGHAHHSTPFLDVPRKVLSWLHLLEEPRMERQVIAEDPTRIPALRVMVANVVGIIDPIDAESAARTLALIGGRMLAGVLSAAHVPDLDDAVAPYLTRQQVAEISWAISDAVDAADGDLDTLIDAANRIRRALHEPGAENSEGDLSAHHDDTADQGNEGDSGDFSAHRDGGSGPGSGDDGKAASDADSSGSSHPGDNPDSGDAAHEGCSWEPADPNGAASGPIARALRETATAAARQLAAEAGIPYQTPAQQARKAAHRADQAAIGDAYRAATHTKHDSTSRPPTNTERRQAQHITRAITRAAYRAPIVTATAQNVPPGNLRTGELVRRAGQLHAGLPPTAQPWTRNRRRRVPTPPLTVAIALDISASMQPYTDAASAASWMLGLAARATKGNSHMVTWNHEAALTTHRPGDHQIASPHCSGGSSGLPQALRVTSRACSQQRGGATLVTVISDGDLTGGTADAAAREMARLTSAGAAVVWLRTPGYSCSLVAPPKVVVVDLDDPDRIGEILAAAAITALRGA